MSKEKSKELKADKKAAREHAAERKLAIKAQKKVRANLRKTAKGRARLARADALEVKPVHNKSHTKKSQREDSDETAEAYSEDCAE